MTIKIILTSYLLTYMYGDRVFQDPLLLSREVLKKSYQDSLYYISNEKNINAILKDCSKKRHLFVFAGIPSFEEVCTDLYPNPVLMAIKIHLPYELFASFFYERDEECYLVKNDILIKESYLEKVYLTLAYEDNHLFYKETKVDEIKDITLSLTEEEICKIKKEFQSSIESYRYAIMTNIKYLKEKLITFLESCDSEALDNEELLPIIKESFETLSL